MHRAVPRAAVLLGAVVPVFGLAACGGSTNKLEKSASEELGKLGYPKAKVDCPSDVNTDKGTTFTCKITEAGKLKSVTYKVINDDGGVAVDKLG